MNKLACLIFTITFLTTALFSQENNLKNVYKEWININFGYADKHDISGGISYNFGCRSFYQIGIYSNSEINLMGKSADYITAFTVAYGKRKFCRYGLAAIFAGPALVLSRTTEGNHARQKTFTTAGILINLHYFLKPIPEIGAGFDLYGNLNFRQTVFGARFALQLGNNK